MNRKEQFAKSVELLKRAKKQGDSIQDTAKEIFNAGSVNSDSINAAIDYAASNSDTWREQFNRAFNLETGIKADPLKKFTGEELEAIEQFAVTRSGAGDATVGNTIQTNILTAMDDVYMRESVLSKVQVVTNTNSYTLPEYGTELTGDRVAENAGSTSKDDVARTGDTLTLGANNNKLRISNVVSRLALESMNPTDLGTMQGRLVRGMSRLIENEVFNGSNASGQAAGFFGTDTTFGAINTTLLNVGVLNHIDAIEYIIGQLPADISDADLSKYVVALNRPTKSKITRITDVNHNYYFDRGLNSITSLLTGVPFYASSVIANDKVGILDLSKYYALMDKMPTIEVRELDNEMYEVKSVCHFDGGITMAYKDAAQKNVHRQGTLLAAYSS